MSRLEEMVQRHAGQPRDGDPRASFAVVDAAALAAEIVRVEYDVPRMVAAMDERGYPPRVAENLRRGRPIGWR